MRTFFSLAAVVMFLLGVSWLFFPAHALTSWGLHPDAGLVLISRRYGVLCLGYAAILWLSRTAERSPARSAILLGSVIANAAMSVVSLTAIIGSVANQATWSAAVIEGLLAAGFAYFWATTR